MNKKKIIACTLACVAMGVCAATNYDLLGRKGSEMNSPMVYRNVDYAKAKNDVKHVLAKQAETAVTPATGRLEQFAGCVKKNGWWVNDDVSTSYWFNDEKLTQSQYLSKVNTYEKNYAPRKKYSGSGEKQSKWDIKPLFSGSKGTFPKYRDDIYYEKSRLERNATTAYKKLDLSHPWASSIARNETGVYLAGDAAPYYASEDKVLNGCNKGNQIHKRDSHIDVLGADAMFKYFAVNPSTYYYDYECDHSAEKKTQFPLWSVLKSKSIYMGIHTNSLEEWDDGLYNDQAAYFDDYIYENRMIEIAAAGNFAKTPSDDNANGHIRKTAAAMNAITVGAAESVSGKVAPYSSWKNPTFASGKKKSYDKPEIYGYTNYYKYFEQSDIIQNLNSGRTFEYFPAYGGTVTAAMYIGGLVESLLSNEPFYRWHPEVVKAMLLTSSSIDVMPKDNNGKVNYVGNDFIFAGEKSNKNLVIGTTNSNRLFKGHRSRYWIANTADEVMTVDGDGKSYLTFEENVEYNVTYRIAISWLSKGSNAKSLGQIPQDFDLYVYDSNGNELAKSETGSNPFEIVEIDSKNNEKIFIKIKLYRNNGERVLLGYDIHASNQFYESCPTSI